MSTRRSKAFSAGAAAFAVALLAACSPGTTDADDSRSGGSSAALDGPLAEVQADVEAAMQPRESFEVPSEPVDASALAGKSVYYIPLTAQSGVFRLYGKTLGAALEKADVNLTVCDGGANPSQIAGCFDQAIGASVGAIVADNIPYPMAANAYDAARSAGIPVVLTNMLEDPAHPADESLAYVPGPASAMLATAADWAIADSAGQATAVLQKVTDNPSTLAYAESAEQEFAGSCPDCTVVVNEVSAANFPLIASSTSAAILQNPDADYVLAMFDLFLQPSIGGVQQTPNAAQTKVLSGGATLDGLQMVKNDNLVHAGVAQNLPYQGWATADAIFRLVSGQDVPEYDVSYRLFAKENIGDIELTAEAEASGEWYGPTDYTKDFAALWGLS